MAKYKSPRAVKPAQPNRCQGATLDETGPCQDNKAERGEWQRQECDEAAQADRIFGRVDETGFLQHDLEADDGCRDERDAEERHESTPGSPPLRFGSSVDGT